MQAARESERYSGRSSTTKKDHQYSRQHFFPELCKAPSLSSPVTADAYKVKGEMRKSKKKEIKRKLTPSCSEMRDLVAVAAAAAVVGVAGKQPAVATWTHWRATTLQATPERVKP